MVQHIAGDLVTIAGQAIDRATVTGLKVASARSGVSFQYLLAKAAQESSLNPEAQAQGSSAAGLFQFTRGTWLDMIKRYGASTGLGDLANKISVSAGGKAQVSDPATEQRILSLREDPEVSALMAAQYARDNAASLKDTLGRSVDSSDLYLAHFLGPTGASLLLNTAADDPSKPAASLMPAAAKANTAVFYNADGSPRSAADVVKLVRGRFASQMSRYAGAATGATSIVANAAPSAPAVSVPGTAAAAGSALNPFGIKTGSQTETTGMSWMMMEQFAKVIGGKPMAMTDDDAAADTTLSSLGLQGSDWAQALSGVLMKNAAAPGPAPAASATPAPSEQASRAYDAVKVQLAALVPPQRSDLT